MTDITGAFRPNIPAIAAEDIDGEVVVVSFDTGHYYSLRDTAADIWRLLDGGVSVQAAVEAVAPGDPAAATAILDFVDQLNSEGLMVAMENSSHPPAAARPVGPYQAPRLERFEEMANMLLYDPIHDVDDTGWPNLPDSVAETP